MASVRERVYKDGTRRFVVDFKDAFGNRVLKTFERKKAATAFRDNIVTEVQAGRFLSRSQVMSWKDAAELWLDDCRKRAAMKDRMTMATLHSYECDVARMSKHLGALNIGDLTTAVAQELVDQLHRKYAPVTVRGTVRTAGSICRFIQDQGRLNRLPFEVRKLRLPAARSKPTIPPKDALRAILAAVTGERSRLEKRSSIPKRTAVIMLALFGGLRRSEICGLQWGDIDFARGAIQINRSRTQHDGVKTPKTKAGFRSVPMVPQLADALQALRSTCEPDQLGPSSFLILSDRGKPIDVASVYGDHWRPVLIKAGIITKDEKAPYRFHALRHAAVSLLIDQGVSAMHIKSMIGHSSVTTTIDIYGHLFPSDDAVHKATGKIAADLLATQTQHDPVSH